MRSDAKCLEVHAENWPGLTSPHLPIDRGGRAAAAPAWYCGGKDYARFFEVGKLPR